jgi:Arc/MetJ-type ribon-helix-helix transcriptional regulator
MPESLLPNTLEQEITQIEKQLAEKRAVLEQQQQSGQIAEVPQEKETLREVVREQYAPPVPSMGSASSPQASSGQVVTPPPPIVEPPSYLSPELKEKVQELVNLAFSQSPSEAIKQARATNNAALIDAFHDALADELYNYLIERGKLKKI